MLSLLLRRFFAFITQLFLRKNFQPSKKKVRNYDHGYALNFFLTFIEVHIYAFLWNLKGCKRVDKIGSRINIDLLKTYSLFNRKYLTQRYISTDPSQDGKKKSRLPNVLPGQRLKASPDWLRVFELDWQVVPDSDEVRTFVSGCWPARTRNYLWECCSIKKWNIQWVSKIRTSLDFWHSKIGSPICPKSEY